jgi:uncharacterized protein (DUF2267 family)
MKLDEFLLIVKNGLGLDSLREADRVVRVVVGALKSSLPEDGARAIAEALPEELSSGWEEVPPLPEDILEREDLYLEGDDEPQQVREEYPTITDG